MTAVQTAPGESLSFQDLILTLQRYWGARGCALLQGIAVCGRCGRRMGVRYSGPRGDYPLLFTTEPEE